MEMLIQLILLLVGFVLLIKGADFFVDGASNLAAILKIPTIIVGLTIVAFGTSAPEAAVSIVAALKGSNAIAVSNIVGSNIFNLLVVIGCSALVGTVGLNPKIIKRDYPFLIFISLLISLFVVTDWKITQIEGNILLVLIISYVAHLVIQAKQTIQGSFVEKPKLSLSTSTIFIIGGLAGVVIGGELVVNSAKYIALSIGISETLVGLTVVAIGTSLPELVTSLTALKKGETDIVIGNVVGSNIFNILLILGLSSTITAIPVATSMLTDLGIMIIATIICYLIAKLKKEYGKKEGIFLIALFIIYMAFIIMRG